MVPMTTTRHITRRRANSGMRTFLLATLVFACTALQAQAQVPAPGDIAARLHRIAGLSSEARQAQAFREYVEELDRSARRDDQDTDGAYRQIAAGVAADLRRIRGNRDDREMMNAVRSYARSLEALASVAGWPSGDRPPASDAEERVPEPTPARDTATSQENAADADGPEETTGARAQETAADTGGPDKAAYGGAPEPPASTTGADQSASAAERSASGPTLFTHLTAGLTMEQVARGVDHPRWFVYRGRGSNDDELLFSGSGPLGGGNADYVLRFDDGGLSLVEATYADASASTFTAIRDSLDADDGLSLEHEERGEDGHTGEPAMIDATAEGLVERLEGGPRDVIDLRYANADETRRVDVAWTEGRSLLVVYRAGTDATAVGTSSREQRPDEISETEPDDKTWTHTVERDAITDETIHVLTNEAVDGGNSFNPPVLRLEWAGGRTRVLIDWQTVHLDIEEIEVTRRVDDREPETSILAIGPETTQVVLPDGADLELIHRLLDASTFVARTTPFSREPSTLVFDVSGLRPLVAGEPDLSGWLESSPE